MTTFLVSLLTLVVGAAVSGLVTYLETKRKLVYDYDADLRLRRINTYADLWKKLEPLAKYGGKLSFSKDDADGLAKSFVPGASTGRAFPLIRRPERLILTCKTS